MSGAAPRRDNGLRAETYERLADVETHLVEGLLERLRDEHVAAYSAPTPGPRGPYGETVPPLGPSDAVFVDGSRRAQARAITDRYLAEVTAELAAATSPDRSTDQAWADIVADFDLTPTDPVPRWPASEDVDDATSEADAYDRRPPIDGPGSGDTGAGDGTPPGGAPTYRTGRDDLEEHFEPPPPPPLPTVDTVTRFAWAGALGGPAVLLLAAVAGLPLAGWVGALAVAAFMAGFVTLVARMQDRPPTDSGPDDGAVV